MSSSGVFPNNPIAKDMPSIMESVMKGVQQYYTLILFITIPLIALISKIVFYNRKTINFAEHNILYAYGYAQFLILSWGIIPFFFIFENFVFTYQWLSIPLLILYHAYLLQRFFQLSWKSLLIKTLLFILVGCVFYVLITLIFVVIYVAYLSTTGA